MVETLTSSHASILEEMLGLDPLCSGSLHEQYLTCGKSECHCHDKRDPQRHGPYIIWRRYIGGKQVNRTLRPDSPEVKKIRRGIANYQRMQELMGRLLRLREKAVLKEDEATENEGKKNFRMRLRKR